MSARDNIPEHARNYSGEPTALYIFVRKDMFYPIMLYDDADARANAECNPGTVRVEDHTGRIVWEAPVLH